MAAAVVESSSSGLSPSISKLPILRARAEEGEFVGIIHRARLKYTASAAENSVGLNSELARANVVVKKDNKIKCSNGVGSDIPRLTFSAIDDRQHRVIALRIINADVAFGGGSKSNIRLYGSNWKI